MNNYNKHYIHKRYVWHKTYSRSHLYIVGGRIVNNEKLCTAEYRIQPDLAEDFQYVTIGIVFLVMIFASFFANNFSQGQYFAQFLKTFGVLSLY